MIKNLNVGVHIITGEEAVELSGYEQRQQRYRESNEHKKARDLDRRTKRQDKRRFAF